MGNGNTTFLRALLFASIFSFLFSFPFFIRLYIYIYHRITNTFIPVTVLLIKSVSLLYLLDEQTVQHVIRGIVVSTSHKMAVVTTVIILARHIRRHHNFFTGLQLRLPVYCSYYNHKTAVSSELTSIYIRSFIAGFGVERILHM